MSFHGENDYKPYENGFSVKNQGCTVKQAYQNGGIASGCSHVLRATYRVVSRRKPLEETSTRLARVLSALDLTALGVGSTLGVGVYVLAGDVAKNYAGPAVILSFLIAAIASIFAGLCYAEFGARVPKAGSAYVYSYVCVGEFIAFLIGWNLILEYVIGAASVVKALSEYLDSLLDKSISTALRAALPMDSPHLASYPDLLAFSVIMLFSVALAFGVKESTKFNNFCTGVNLCVVAFVIISGLFKADTKNWRIPQSEVPKDGPRDFGSGGFAPYGIAGIIKGAAVCFYGFIGFDCVATAGEEARAPQKSIPIAVVGSLLIVLFAYIGVSSVLTLMLPYYLQDEKAPLPGVYSLLGWGWAKYGVSVGALCALCSSLLGAVFPLPRIIYAMSSDGLVWAWLGNVSSRYHTPLAGTLVAGLLTGTLAMLFQLEQLIHMMSIGTLLAYSCVAACVLLLRYEQSSSGRNLPIATKRPPILRALCNADRIISPTEHSARLVTVLVTLYGVWCGIAMYVTHHHWDSLTAGSPLPLAALIVSGSLAIGSLASIARQPTSDKKLAFSVPWVPWLPGVSILTNLYLMMNLDYPTWIRFGVWILMGLVMYVTYGVWHSAERERRRTSDLIPLADLHTDSHTMLLNHGGVSDHAMG